MRKLKTKFTATGNVIEFGFSKTPKLSDVFEYNNTFYMVVDYDGEFVHVVEVNKLSVQVIEE